MNDLPQQLRITMAQLVVGGRVTGEELLILGKIHEMPDQVGRRHTARLRESIEPVTRLAANPDGGRMGDAL